MTSNCRKYLAGRQRRERQVELSDARVCARERADFAHRLGQAVEEQCGNGRRCIARIGGDADDEAVGAAELA